MPPAPPDDSAPDETKPSGARPLATEEINAVLARNDVAAVVQALDNGRFLTSRERYAFCGSAIYLLLSPFFRGTHLQASRDVQCDVSEVHGLSGWNYVTVHGQFLTLYPSGSAAERIEWHKGIDALRLTMPELEESRLLALENQGVVRVDILSRSGSHMTMELGL